ncbi:related to 4-coumarate-CoA ligase [Ustilago bromivora]|uniref:Related to 4-coumarate-CoA ligase n=1 Tax=Ustilago bromivora TaxID=307758 RepID=A0A1K0GL85_9BASI|nr:related to 4-coumarate-CoA ligase [Ustilago bromivora]SYW78400.1 related to 4-coumarate-CoA ligase [Ustilago bromivora]
MAPQILRSLEPAPSRVQRGNLFDFLYSNPNKVDENKPAFYRLDGLKITRKQLQDDARRLAYSLRHKLGLQPGSRIAIVSPNSTVYPLIVHAGLCAGVVLVPLNAAYGPEELVHPIHEADVDYIFCHQSALSTAREGLEQAKKGLKSKNGQNRLWILDDGDSLKKGDKGEQDARTLLGEERLETHKVVDDRTEDAFIVFSSGTSGKPKGVQLVHGNITAVTTAIVTTFSDAIGSNDRYVAVLPMFHIFGLVKNIMKGVYTGAESVVLPRFDLDVFCSAVEKFKCNVSYVVPPILVLLAKDPRTKKYNLKSLKWVMSGAAPLGAELSLEVEATHPGLKVTQGWGLSETSPTATFARPDEYHAHMGSCGRLLAGVEGRLVDEDGNDVGFEQGENGKPGEFWVRGPTIMKGYLNNKEATDDCITPDGWFKTGDVAIMKDNFFWIVDRKKELIKYKGFQVPPAELEATLLSHPKIADAAVIGIQDKEQATELPRAYVVLKKDVAKSENPDAVAKEIIEWTATKVANHKRLRGGVRILEVIPKSPSGKILRRLLRDEAAKESQ